MRCLKEFGLPGTGVPPSVLSAHYGSHTKGNFNMMYARECGSTDAAAIIFLHGGPLTSRMWEPVIDRLRDFYCLAPDLPGHGHSRDLGPFDLDRAAVEVAELIGRKVASGRAHVVGVSLGGAVGLTIERLAPEVVDHLMVSGSAAKLGKTLGVLGLAAVAGSAILKPETVALATVRQMHVPPEYGHLVYDDLIENSSLSLNFSLVRNLMRMRLPEVTLSPLLVAVGEKETPAAKSAAKALLSKYPQAQGICVPGLNHLWALENPDLFAGTVRAWVWDKPLPASLKRL
jgi:pimeloyl-ACP methyl ester carboxylesterase